MNVETKKCLQEAALYLNRKKKKLYKKHDKIM